MIDADQVALGNRQIEDYLKFFINTRGGPGYAVFLNGEWGSGKTWFINKFKETNTEHKYLYVSLYGVSSVSEIDDQFFQQLHPVLASKPFTIGAKVLKGALKGTLKYDFGEGGSAEADLGIPPLDVQKFLSDSENRILIFDDLERCKIIQEALGYINHFVEHQSQKVILIGHEEEIPTLGVFRKINEKLIGRRFTVRAEIAEAFPAFINLLTDESVKQVLIKNSETILKVYSRSGTNNLRTLRHSIVEFARFYSQLPAKAKEHEQFLADCVDAFFALCIELKAGTITTKAIRSLTSHYRNYFVSKSLNRDAQKGKVEPDQLSEMYEKHFGTTARELMPNEESLFFFFEYGVIPESVIMDALEGSRYFAQQNTPAWMKLWHYYSLSESEFQDCFSRTMREFATHQLTDPGVLRHVVGILLHFSKEKLIEMTPKKTASLVTTVVSDMIRKGLVVYSCEREERFPRFDDCYAGLQFQSRENRTFKLVSEKLREGKSLKSNADLREAAAKLVPTMKSDPKAFCRMLTPGSSSDQPYSDVPILQHVSPNDFVAGLIEMNPGNASRFEVAHIFKERYTLLGPYPALAEELLWLRRVDTLLKRRSKQLKQPTKHILQLLRTGYLLPAIERIEEWNSTPSNPKKVPNRK